MENLMKSLHVENAAYLFKFNLFLWHISELEYIKLYFIS